MNLPFSAGSPVARDRAHGVTLVLGPTNTGKTHYAIERLLAHRTGMIGLPLRLLAREVYNRVVEKVGVEAVALITGEEKLKPPRPRYWICTVEAMPRDLDLAFVAVDEVQLAAGFDRGHVFTDRLLNRRGTEETLLIGAQTMERALTDLLPGARIVSRPRMSNLTFAGEKKISRLPPRTAVVAFSAEEVYAIAEWIRRQRGGAAVVLGALSPRTRNAQVDMYQSGDVDYIVATDAIGMGLNLDVDHIAFAGDRKFDGWHYRRLHPAEFGQIAGRAGRHVRDGTFGTTGRCPPFDGDLVEMLETHHFDRVSMLQWRNTALDTSSIDALAASLDLLPDEPGLTRAPLAPDQITLDIAARDAEVRKVARNRGDVARLWDCCQIPDYRKLSPAAHADLALSVYRFVARAGRIPDDWFVRHIDALDRVDGDIDALSARIAQVRTWTYIANRPDWLRDPEHWQAVARRVEDTLSDALHERLAQRFVDRRTSVLRRRLRENAIMDAEITSSGDVLVEGQHVGQLSGFRFTSDPGAAGEEARTLNAAAQKALASEIGGRATRVSEAVDEAFVLANDGLIRWLGEPVGRITAGAHILEPQVRIIADEQLTGPALELVQRRLDLWTQQHVTKLLGPLRELEGGDVLEGIVRGVAFQIAESLGVLERARVAEEVKALPQEARALLRKLGVRFGAYHLYLPALVKPAPRALAAQLWALKNGGVEDVKGLDQVPHLAASGRTSFVADQDVPKGFYRAAGFRVCGDRAVRVDILERLADLIRPAIAYRPGATPGAPPSGAADNDGFVVTVEMTSLAGCSGETFGTILRSLGYVLNRRAGPPITVPLIAKAATDPVLPSADAPAAEPAPVLPETTAAEKPAAAKEPAATDEGDLQDRVSLARQSELIAAALEGGALDAIEPLPAPRSGATAAAEPAGAAADDAPNGEDVPALSSEAIAETASAEGEPEAPPAASGMPIEGAAAAPVEDAAPAVDEQSADPASAEPVMIEVWRPHRHNVHNRRPADRNRGPRQNNEAVRPREGVASPSGDPLEQSKGPRQRRGDGNRPAQGRQDRRNGEPRAHGDKRANGDQRRERWGNSPTPHEERRQAPRAGHEKGRDKQPDPNSPFAKLAALKAQMEKDR